MGRSGYVARLRARVGTELLILPSVAVLPRDDDGRMLLVRQAEGGGWATIGGAIEVDEDPESAAIREAREEAGISIRITRLLAALGGPRFRIRYANGDEVSYVSIVYEAVVRSGVPAPDDEETTAVGWFTTDELGALELTPFARETFGALGWL